VKWFTVHTSKNTQAAHFPPIYKTSVEDRTWVNSGMVAHVKAGDSTLSFQQRIDDAGFPNVIVTLLGGDRVFLNCIGGEDFSKVLAGAQDFFGVLFSNFHKWSESLVKYERGAWLRVYGIHVHAWNDIFFKLCVSGIGRFLHVDECTTDKSRLDFARVLVTTLNIEIVNKTSEFVIDGSLYVIKLVEEWGCYLGEDVFLSEAETESIPEVATQVNNMIGLDEVQGEWELDDLVNDLHNEWQQHERKVVGSHKSVDSSTSDVKDICAEFFEVQLSPVLQPISPSASIEHKSLEGAQQNNDSQLNGSDNQGPWSIDWIANQKTISEGGVVFSSSRKSESRKAINAKVTTSTSLTAPKIKKRGVVLQSVGLMKKINCMPVNDRKQIIRILNRQKCKKKARVMQHVSKPAKGSTSESSKNSTPSINNND